MKCEQELWREPVSVGILSREGLLERIMYVYCGPSCDTTKSQNPSVTRDVLGSLSVLSIPLHIGL